jgi:hypothetical protein
MLLALSTNYSNDQYDTLRNWLKEVNEYVMSPSLTEYLNEYTNIVNHYYELYVE